MNRRSLTATKVNAEKKTTQTKQKETSVRRSDGREKKLEEVDYAAVGEEDEVFRFRACDGSHGICTTADNRRKKWSSVSVNCCGSREQCGP